MIDQGLGAFDLESFGDAAAETDSTFAEAITIRRFTSQPSSAGAFLTPQKIIFTDFAATAVVVDLGVAAKMFESGVLSAGDLVLQMRDRLNEGSENIGGSVVADRVVYRGMEYRMVQRPRPVTIGAGLGPEAPFYIVHLRRTNSTADTVGL